MRSQKNNILGQFIKIVDAEKCFSDLNHDNKTNLLWASQSIRNKAGKSEWNKYNYTPKNGDIGEIVACLDNSIFTEPVYVIRIFGMFYVPISLSGFEIIRTKQSIHT